MMLKASARGTTQSGTQKEKSLVSLDNHIQHAFAVGCPRSGTTLLQRMIAEHPSVVTCPETFIFQGIMSWDNHREGAILSKGVYGSITSALRQIKWRLAYNLNYVHPTARLSLQRLVDDLGLEEQFEPERVGTNRVDELIALFIDCLNLYAQSQNASCWIEKTPTHVNYLNEIEQFVPEAKFIHVIRKNTDAVASLFDMSLRYPDQQWTKRYASIDRCCERWCIAVRDSLAKKDSSKHCLLRFEDIIEDYDQCTSIVDHFLSCDPSLRTYNEPDVSGLAYVKSSEPWKKQVFEENKKPEEKFKKIFTESQQAEVIRLTEDVQTQVEQLLPRLSGNNE